jgi:hypothetical protein
LLPAAWAFLAYQTLWLQSVLGLSAIQAVKIATWLRGHRGTENRLDRVLHATYDEDRSSVRTDTSPAPWPHLRNLSLTISPINGAITQVTRHHVQNHTRPINLLLTI